MRLSRRTLLFFLLIVLLGAGAIFVDLPSTPGIHVLGMNISPTVNEGLDLKGGVQLVLTASCPQAKPNCDKSQYMPAVIDNIQRRISGGLGLNDAVVRAENGNRVLVQLPGLKDDTQARQLLGTTGQMNIINTGSTSLPLNTDVTGKTCTTNCAAGQYKIVFTGDQLDVNQISAGTDPNSGQPIVTFAFTGNAKGAFGTYTRNNINNFLTITLDNKVIESATIQSEIDGQGQITGIPTIQQAQTLASYLKYGALPLPLAITSEQQLAATLGQQAIMLSIRAALIGLGMVMLFMIIYYRLPGFLADVALLLYAVFLFAVIKLSGATLSLPGIAAIILTIGMAVDANILIFERMKEELRAGRTMASAVDLGFKRAWPSIRDSNASTLITAFILYWFGNNFGATIVVGFAVNLAIGVLISLFTAVVVTRNFLQLLLFSGIATHPALYGLPKSALNLPRYRPSQRRPALGTTRAAVAGVGGAAAVDVPADDTVVDDAGDDVSEEELAHAGNGRTGTTTTGRTSPANTTRGAEE